MEKSLKSSVGIAGVALYAIPFFFWPSSTDSLDLYLRTSAIFLYGFLIFTEDWPPFFKKIYPFYWTITLIYTLSFLNNYIFLKNTNVGWLIQVILSSFILMLLVPWKHYILYTIIGALPAYILTGKFDIIFFYVHGICLLVSIFFVRTKEEREKQKIETIQALSGSIAHELSTPLVALQLQIDFLLKNSPRKIPKSLSLLVQNAITITEMLNMSIKDLQKTPLTSLKISDQLIAALNTYPTEEKILVSIPHDFTFQGNSLVFSHVIFNLLKNALYFSKGNGIISITTEESPYWNKVTFKDTGTGIDAKDLPYIFDRFYSKRPLGTGLGLFFCAQAMQIFKGNIKCYSEKGKYASFVLSFPKEV